MSTVKTCAACGKSFSPYHPNRQVLCTECSTAKNKKRSHTFAEKACEQCGSAFQPKTLRARYCSTSCQQRARYLSCLPDLSRVGVKGPRKGSKQTAEHKAKRAESVARTIAQQKCKCVHCGDEFTRTRPAQKYCSGKCWNTVARTKKAKLHRISVSPVLYQALSDLQYGKCAICGIESGSNGRKDRLAVDHIHGTETIRGLLCHRCNTAIGLFKDNIESLRSAISYLEKHQ